MQSIIMEQFSWLTISIYAGSKNTEIYIECPLSITEATLGEPPRKVYPLVVVTVRQNPSISLDYTAIVSTLYIQTNSVGPDQIALKK